VGTCAVPCQVQDSRSGVLPDLSQRTDRTSCDDFYSKEHTCLTCSIATPSRAKFTSFVWVHTRSLGGVTIALAGLILIRSFLDFGPLGPKSGWNTQNLLPTIYKTTTSRLIALTPRLTVTEPVLRFPHLMYIACCWHLPTGNSIYVFAGWYRTSMRQEDPVTWDGPHVCTNSGQYGLAKTHITMPDTINPSVKTAKDFLMLFHKWLVIRDSDQAREVM